MELLLLNDPLRLPHGAMPRAPPANDTSNTVALDFSLEQYAYGRRYDELLAPGHRRSRSCPLLTAERERKKDTDDMWAP